MLQSTEKDSCSYFEAIGKLCDLPVPTETLADEDYDVETGFKIEIVAAMFEKNQESVYDDFLERRRENDTAQQEEDELQHGHPDQHGQTPEEADELDN